MKKCKVFKERQGMSEYPRDIRKGMSVRRGMTLETAIQGKMYQNSKGGSKMGKGYQISLGVLERASLVRKGKAYEKSDWSQNMKMRFLVIYRISREEVGV